MAPVALIDRAWFGALAEAVCADDGRCDRTTLLLKSEASEFIRFNRGLVRQATSVQQGHVTLAVVRDGRRIETTMSVTGRLGSDVDALATERQRMLEELPQVPVDRFLTLPDTVHDSHRHESGHIPDAGELIGAVVDAARGLDLVGFYAGGPIVRAFADSRGQRNWHHVESFHFEWSLYSAGDKAVKSTYAGTHWSADEFASRLRAAAQRLPLLTRTPRVLDAGRYRAYLAPAAVAELISTVGWSGFGIRARRNGTSSLARLAGAGADGGGVSLDASVTLREAPGDGLAPAFTEHGFARPAELLLIDHGRARQTLNSPRSAREFGVAPNGGDAQETPDSPYLSGGTLAAADALAALDTGLFISNLWYLNYSDRSACRMTGMTRFACFWVEGGRLVEPLQVMRFDDSFLRMFGSGLHGLTRETELLPESSTYGERQLASTTVPGALIDGWQLTL